MERKDNYWLRRRLNRRGFVAGSAGVMAGAAAFAAVGCGGDDDSGGKETATTNPASGAGAASPTSAATSAGGSAHTPAGTLRVAVASLMDQSVDPFFQTGGLAQPINTHLFDSFWRTGDDGQREPDLAESFEVSADRTEITFKMRKGVKFWDGTEMTAEDAAFSFQAYSQRQPPNPNVAVTRGQVESATATDPSTVVVKLKKPTPFEGREITWWNITSKAHYEKVGEAASHDDSMGTGPFKVAKNVKGQYLELEANPGHWNKNRIPYVKTLRFNIVPELTTRLAQLRAGEAEITEGVTGATAQSLKNEAGIKIVTSSQTALLKLNFVEAQAGTAPWTDIRLREALVIAVNQEEIAKGLLKQGTPAPDVQLWPKTLGYDEKMFPARKYDPDRAKQLINEAGLQGFSFTVNSYASSSYPLIPEVCQAAAGYWGAIGLKPQISQHEAGGYFAQFTARQLKGVAAEGWPFMPDARLIAVQYYKTGSPYGATDGYKEIDDGIQQLIDAKTEEEQLDLAKKVHKYVYDNHFFAAVPYSDSQWATTDKVTAWIRPAGDPFLTRLESVQLKG